MEAPGDAGSAARQGCLTLAFPVMLQVRCCSLNSVGTSRVTLRCTVWGSGFGVYPKAQSNPKAVHSMVFGPKSLKI